MTTVVVRSVWFARAETVVTPLKVLIQPLKRPEDEPTEFMEPYCV